MLAAYVVLDAGRRLAGFGTETRESTIGIVVTAISLMVMQDAGEERVAYAAQDRCMLNPQVVFSVDEMVRNRA